MAQPPEQPALDHEDRLLDLRLVPWPSWPGRQNGGAVMRRHIGVAAVDLRIVAAGLDHRTLVLSGTSSAGTPPIASKAPTWPLIQSASPCVQVACA